MRPDAPSHYARFAFCKRDEVLDEAVARLRAHFGARALTDGRVKGLNAAPRMAGIAQLAERQVVVLDVTGSSPVARPIRLTAGCPPRPRRCGQPGVEAAHRLLDVLER